MIKIWLSFAILVPGVASFIFMGLLKTPPKPKPEHESTDYLKFGYRCLDSLKNEMLRFNVNSNNSNHTNDDINAVFNGKYCKCFGNEDRINSKASHETIDFGTHSFRRSFVD